MKVYQAINKVQSALAKEGISKDRKNQQQGYSFRGIDDVYNSLSPLLAEHGLCILPRILTRQCDERQTAKGGTLFYVTVEAEFDFVCAEDGSKHVVRTFGEAMDSADKATNKAMSAAYKYAAFQAFAIPTEGDNDADAITHQAISKARVTPTAGAMDGFSDEEQIFLKETAASIARMFNQNEPIAKIYGELEERHLGNEEKIAIWSLLDSKCRSAIKKHKESLKPSLAEQA